MFLPQYTNSNKQISAYHSSLSITVDCSNNDSVYHHTWGYIKRFTAVKGIACILMGEHTSNSGMLYMQQKVQCAYRYM